MGTAAVLGVLVASIYLLFPRRRGKREAVKGQSITPIEAAPEAEAPDIEGKAIS